LTAPQGQIVDCNEAFARIFGFDSRTEVLARTAWDFYFNRADRDALVTPSHVVENHSGEERIFRNSSGAPICVVNTRVVGKRINGNPVLVLGTSTDITEQKALTKQVRELSQSSLALPDQTPRSPTPFSAEPELATVSEELNALLRQVNESLRPGKLTLMSRADAQDFVFVVERMKVLVQRLEILRLTGALRRDA
jgi:PAS domain S-box-containing protein